MKRFLLLSFTIVIFGHIALAQDIQYSQFYANALYLNPAFAGANQTSRVIAHSRLQWPGLDASYIGSTFSYDHYFAQIKSGIGVLINSDYQRAYGNTSYRTLDLGFQYAYQVDLSEEWTFRPAIQFTVGNRKFVPVAPYGDQMNAAGQVPGLTTSDPTHISNPNFTFPDIGAGGLLFSKKAWVGLATHHLNQPTQDYFTGSTKLAVKTTLHAGMKFMLNQAGSKIRRGQNSGENEFSLSPVMIYKMQGKFNQLDLGAYVRYDYFIVGTWYRGLPFKLYPSENANNESMVVLLGGTYRGFNLGYSYDFTISKLAPAGTAGAHELSLSYNFIVEYTKKKRLARRHRAPVCPKF